MNTFRYISDLIIKHKYRYLLGVTSILVVDTLQLVMPKVLGKITDLLKDGLLTKEGLLKYSLIVSAIAVGIAIFRFLWRYLVFGASKSIEASLRNRFYAHLQKLSLAYYNSHKTGDLMAHATNDINNVRMALGPGITMSFDSAVIPAAALIMMLNTVGFKLTLAAFIPLIILGVIIAFFVRAMHVRVRKMQEAFSQLTETARENFSGIRVVKSFVQEIKEVKKFEKSNKYNKEMNLKYIRLISMLFPMIMSVSALSFAVALWYGGIQVIDGRISLGDFVAFTSYLGMLIWPVAAIGWVTSLFQRGSVSLKRINKILDEEPEIKDCTSNSSLSKLRGKIEFKNLTFSYPGSKAPVLQNINLLVEEGKTLAVIGRTGSGKTTLINLLLHLYNVKNESLLIDDMDINDIPLALLRRSIGCVPQDPFLFSTTIRENIDFFEGKSFEEIVEAAKTAGIYDDIIEFPHQFETVVGERGVTLSGGQKQRIAIARAILRNPSILILDDCLSAVDTQTEERILTGLRKVMKNRTSIITSHRISTIKKADEIIVLEEGRIVERGTHRYLIQRQGLYFNMYQKQLLSEQIEKEE